MARSKGWAIFISFLLGLIGASLFWLYGPFFPNQLAQQVAQDLKTQPLAVEVAKPGPAGLKTIGSQALGPRFQMVTDGKQVFLADLKEGRVWRYYHQTKETGASREDEGFLPIPLYYAGKKHYSAAEVEPPGNISGTPSPVQPQEKKHP
jgi:hypothetical protein